MATLDPADFAASPPLSPPDDAELRLEHQRATLSLQALGGGLWDYDVDTDALYCSDRWYRILGLDPATTPVRSIADFRPHIHPEDINLATCIDPGHVADLMTHNALYRVDFRVVRPDGAVRWVRSVACLLRDEASGRLRAVGCITDITEARATEEGPPDRGSVDRMAPPPSESVGDRTAEPAANPLTRQERSCLCWTSRGKTAWEIAAILGLSRRTVEFHLHNATRKLGAANRVQAACIAVHRALIETPDL